MNSWDNRLARQVAKTAFWAKLKQPANATLRKKCIKYPSLARIEFADSGGFYLEEQKRAQGDENLIAIPLDVEFRVFEDDVASRDKLVTLVLRRELTMGNEPTDDHQVWLCTWWPYEDRVSETAATDKK